MKNEVINCRGLNEKLLIDELEEFLSNGSKSIELIPFIPHSIYSFAYQ